MVTVELIASCYLVVGLICFYVGPLAISGSEFGAVTSLKQP